MCATEDIPKLVILESVNAPSLKKLVLVGILENNNFVFKQTLTNTKKKA
jgi:hypothetical protein